MNKRKRVSGDYFEVKRKDLSCSLADHFDTIEEAQKEIEFVNKRATERGYKAEEYIIVHIEWYRYFDENGVFEKEEIIKQVVAK